MLDVFAVAKLEWVFLFSGKLLVIGRLWQRKKCLFGKKKLNFKQEHSLEALDFPIKFAELLD